MKIKFLGAAGTVTGSCYLVTTAEYKFIVDCGMFQGPEVEERNSLPFPFNASEVDFVLLTHAHIDHSGLLPKLTRHGFRGEIYATNRTVAISNLLLLDSAKIQEINAREGKYNQGLTGGQSTQYYDSRDAEYANSRFRVVKFHEEFNPRPGLTMEYTPAGHILGAASIVVSADGKKMVFSGDIGRADNPVINSYDPDDKHEVDAVLMESLYGGIIHPSRESSVYEMINIIQDTTRAGGNVLIPAFAVERTQELLLDLKHAKESGALPADLPVFVDSPLASKVTEIYIDALGELKVDAPETAQGRFNPFDFPGLRVVRSSKQSQKLKTQKGAVIVAGSGMVNGGRILSHVVKHMPNPKNHLVIVGYQAEETYGRALVEGAKELLIEGVNIPIKGKVTYLQGFSAHADQNDLLGWLERFRTPRMKKIFLVHAEHSRSEAFQTQLKSMHVDSEIIIPEWLAELEV
jgi:metallo-beta-lactamase family protein